MYIFISIFRKGDAGEEIRTLVRLRDRILSPAPLVTEFSPFESHKAEQNRICRKIKKIFPLTWLGYPRGIKSFLDPFFLTAD